MDFFTTFLQHNPATITLVLLIVTVSIVGFLKPSLFAKLVMVPYSLYKKERLYTLLTAPLVHKNVLHLLLNLLVLLIVGMGLEKDLKLERQSPFLLLFFFFLCALLANIGSSWRHRRNLRVRSMGSSGGALGLMAIHLLLNPFKYMLNIQPIGHFNGLAVLLFLFVLVSLSLSRQSDEMVDHWNHFFGVLGGTIIGLLFFWHNTAGIFSYYLG
ncbi:rhomboid family intramembrane serine protease [Olivibacter sitiensis]|uniref:rhomboid family intramembrane serine protease n=1 Tax=Olivibacter sitiensis TaxID=376470 RepID=UPI0003FB5C49|nr:rhomboid family intramembrane serine protease [Olivibacter sitiensis]